MTAHANLNWAKTTVNQFNRIHELHERSKIIPHEVAIQLQIPFKYLLSKPNIPHEHCLKRKLFDSRRVIEITTRKEQVVHIDCIMNS